MLVHEALLLGSAIPGTRRPGPNADLWVPHRWPLGRRLMIARLCLRRHLRHRAGRRAAGAGWSRVIPRIETGLVRLRLLLLLRTHTRSASMCMLHASKGSA